MIQPQVHCLSSHMLGPPSIVFLMHVIDPYDCARCHSDDFPIILERLIARAHVTNDDDELDDKHTI